MENAAVRAMLTGAEHLDVIYAALDQFDDLLEGRIPGMDPDSMEPMDVAVTMMQIMSPAVVASFKLRGLDPVYGTHAA